MKRTVLIGNGSPPATLLIRERRSDRTYGLGIWLMILCALIALVVMNKQDHVNQNTTPAQESTFRQEQARRLTALGIGPVTTGGVAYAEQ
jgi:cytochrome c-type biogenesis protein CcmE